MTTDAYGNEVELDEKAVANEIKRAQDAIKEDINTMFADVIAAQEDKD